MKLKGKYNPATTYDVGDVVLNSNVYDGETLVHNGDEVVYALQKEAPAGTGPLDTLYWGRVEQTVGAVVKFIMDLSDAVEGLVNSRISKDAIALSGAGENPKEYIITVDESGDTPELVVTEASEESGD